MLRLVANQDGECQGHKVSPHSPGCVSDGEVVVRSIDFPAREDIAGGINESLFQDAFTVGASVQRLAGTWEDSRGAIHQRFEARAVGRREGQDGRPANPDWKYVACTQIPVSALRAVQLDEAPKVARIRAYDAADRPDDPLHADVIADDAGLDRRLRKLLRVKLMTLATSRGIYLSPFLPHDDPARTKLGALAIVE